MDFKTRNSSKKKLRTQSLLIRALPATAGHPHCYLYILKRFKVSSELVLTRSLITGVFTIQQGFCALETKAHVAN